MTTDVLNSMEMNSIASSAPFASRSNESYFTVGSFVDICYMLDYLHKSGSIEVKLLACRQGNTCQKCLINPELNIHSYMHLQNFQRV